jgi:hypothetical protein
MCKLKYLYCFVAVVRSKANQCGFLEHDICNAMFLHLFVWSREMRYKHLNINEFFYTMQCKAYVTWYVVALLLLDGYLSSSRVLVWVVFFIFSVLFYGHVHPLYNPSFSACFFSQNSVFLSQQTNQQYFSAGLSTQPNGAYSVGVFLTRTFKG